MLLLHTFPDKVAVIALLSGALLATIFLALGLYLKNIHLTSRVKTALVLLSGGLLAALLLPPQLLILVYGFIMLGVTVVSGAQYIAAGLPACLQRGIPGVFKVITAMMLPLTALALMNKAVPRMPGIVVLILALEFASQGLDIWFAQEGRKDISWFKNFIGVPLIMGAFMVEIYFLGIAEAVKIFLYTVAGLCFLYSCSHFLFYRRAQ